MAFDFHHLYLADIRCKYLVLKLIAEQPQNLFLPVRLRSAHYNCLSIGASGFAETSMQEIHSFLSNEIGKSYKTHRCCWGGAGKYAGTRGRLDVEK